MDRHIATVPKNRQEQVRVEISEFRGHDLVNIRTFFESNDAGCLPTKKGVSLKLERLDELIEALHETRVQAHANGLSTSISGRS